MHPYAPGRRAAERMRLDGARSLRDADASQFPPGVHHVDVIDSFRSGSIRVRGVGGRTLLLVAPARDVPPPGARVRIEVALDGDADILLLSDGSLAAVDRTGAVLSEGRTHEEVSAWLMERELRLVRPMGRLLR